MVTTLFISLFILLILGVPVAFSMGLSSIFAMILGGISLEVAMQRIFAALDSFPLMAIPFFILAGSLMEHSGISKRLINVANSVAGNLTGGLGIVTVITAMLFSSISGSGAATVAALGGILIPAMVERGFPKNIATSIQAVSGELGVIIPPSIPLIIFAVSVSVPVSIRDLFMASLVPGVVIAISLMVVIYFIAKVKGLHTNVSRNTSELEKIGFLTSLKQAILPLFMPLIILGGIYGGVFTPTEAAAVAVGYALIIGVFVYKTLNVKTLMKVFKNSAISSSIIMFIIGNAGLFGWVLTSERVPSRVTDLFLSISESPIVFLILVNIILLIVGMFMESGAAIVIMAPILTPVALSYNIDPTHFGVLMIVNLAVGMITPPVGVNLFVACQIANIRIEQLLKPLLPFYAVLVFDILLITYLPQLSLWIPQLFDK